MSWDRVLTSQGIVDSPEKVKTTSEGVENLDSVQNLDQALEEPGESAVDFYKDSFYPQSMENELLMDNLQLHSTAAKLDAQMISNSDLNQDDHLYKSSSLGVAADIGTGQASFPFNDTRKALKKETYVKFSYSEIPQFLDLIFDKINSQSSSYFKDPLQPASVVFQMIRFCHLKKQNKHLAHNLFDLFVNRVYLLIEEDTKSDIVFIAYWISVINHLYYFLLRSDYFFTENPTFLKKIASMYHDLINEFVNGISKRLSHILDNSLIFYTSLPELKEGLLFQNDWNLFKSAPKAASGASHTFQDILDILYPPNLLEQQKPSPVKVLQVLEAIIYVFKLYSINSLLLKTLLSKAFNWIQSYVFNKVILNKKSLSRTFAVQLRLNLSTIEDWVLSISKSIENEDLEVNGETNNEFLEELLIKGVERVNLDIVTEFENEESIVEEEIEVSVEEDETKGKGGVDAKKIDTQEKKEGNESSAEKREVGDTKDDIKSDSVIEEEEKKKKKKSKTIKKLVKKKVKNDLNPLYTSQFFYSSLHTIFRTNFSTLFSLLEFLQVGTSYMETLKKQNDKLSEAEIEVKFLQFIEEDFKNLNYKQIHYICKNYRFELEEKKYSKRFIKSLSKKAKDTDSSLSETLDINYCFRLPICLPSKQELVNKFGADCQPFLSDEVKDLIDEIHDQKYYMEYSDTESDTHEEENETSKDENYFNMSEPTSTAAKTWELNDHTTKQQKPTVDFEYNPW